MNVNDLNIMTEKYKALFAKSFYGYEINFGWMPIVETLLSQINRYCIDNNATVHITTIKEKIGGLRVYYYNCDKTDSIVIDDLIKQAEQKCASTCSVCGKEGMMRHGSWYRTLCDYHAIGYGD